MKTSESITKIAPALLAAQKQMDHVEESRCMRVIYGGQRRWRKKDEDPIETFFRRVAFGATECWHWTGAKSEYGYGIMPDESSAHRFSHTMFIGPIPLGKIVMHKCDNPACVNPDHLITGTNKDNSDDMIAKGRQNHECLRGERNHKAKLTRQSVAEIRASTEASSRLAVKYGVVESTINRVRKYQNWTK